MIARISPRLKPKGAFSYPSSLQRVLAQMSEQSERTREIRDNRPNEGEIKERKVRLGRLVVFAFVFR